MSGNDDLKSRFEIYLEAALNSIEVDGLPKPISRADQYLLALIAKMREMTGPVGPMPALVNDLTTGGTDAALTAEQGKTLKDLVDENSASISALTSQKANKTDADMVNVINRCNLALTSLPLLKLPNTEVVSGAISKWYDQSTGKLKAYQATAANRPTSLAKVPLLVSTTAVPDIAQSTTGKGFTITGLAYDSALGCWWAGNAGKNLPGDSAFYPSLVKLSADFKTKLAEIDLHTTFSAMSTVQGVCVDTSDNTLWIASYEEHKVRHITKAGANIASFALATANGIAYDSRTDTLWVLTDSALKHLTKTGTELSTLACAYTAQDHIWLDETNNKIYFTAGANYAKNNYVYVVDLGTNTITLAYNLVDSYAVEGIWINGTTMYIANDGYYHSASYGVNVVNKYDLSTLRSCVQFDSTNNGLTIDANAAINDLTQMTIAVVFQPHGAGGSGVGRLLDKIGTSVGWNWYYENNGATTFFCQYRADGLSWWSTPVASVPLGKKVCAILTFNKAATTNMPSIYLNGVSQSLTVGSSYTGAWTSDAAVALTVGNKSTLDKAFNGLIYEAYIIPRALSAADVATLDAMIRAYYDITA